jgi:tetratricopeptide (TPR) repeat protein
MSSQPPQNLPDFGSDYTADSNMPSPRSPGNQTRVLVVLFWIMCAVVVVVGGTVYFGFSFVASLNEPDRQAEILIGNDQSNRERMYESIAAAFQAEEISVTNRDAESIKRLLKAVFRYGQVDDHAAIRRLIDPQRFGDRMVSSGNVSGLNFVDRAILVKNFNAATLGPPTYQDFKIVTIDNLGHGVAVVYYLAWDDPRSVEECRCWVTKSTSGRWTIADWESISDGISEASQYAVLWEHQETSGVDAYYETCEGIVKFWEFYGEREIDLAEQQLASLPIEEIHPTLIDKYRLTSAFLNGHLEKWETMKSIADRIDSGSAPGQSYVLADYYHRTGESEQAIKYARQYLSLVGVSPNCNRIIAYECEELGRMKECGQALIECLHWFPDDYESITSLLWILPQEDFSLIEQYIASTESPIATAVLFAINHQASNNFRKLAALSSLIEKQDADSTALGFLRGLTHESLFEQEQAIDAYEKAIATESDEALKQQYAAQYLDAALNMGRPLRAYLESSNRAERYDEIIAYYDDVGLPHDDFIDFLDEHARGFPDDPWVEYYRGDSLMNHGDLSEAAEVFHRDIHRQKPDGVAVPALRHAYLRVRCFMDQGLDAYANARDKDDAFQILAEIYQSSGLGGKLNQLLITHRKNNAEDPWLPFFETGLAVDNGDVSLALKTLEQVKLPDPRQRYRIQRLRSRVLIASGTWSTELEHATNTEELYLSLAAEFKKKSKWEELRQLTSAFRQQAAGSKVWLPYQFALDSRGEDVGRRLAAFREYTVDDIDQIGSWRISGAKWELLEDLCKQGHKAGTKELAESIYENEDQPDAMLLYHLYADNSEEVEKYLIELSEQDNFDILLGNSIYDPLFVNPQFASALAQTPLRLPFSGNLVAKLYFATNETPNADDVKNQFVQLYDTPCQVTSADVAQQGYVAYHAQTDVADLLISIRNEPLLVKQNYIHPEPREIFSAPRGEIRIELIRFDSDREEIWLLLEAVKQLVNDRCLALVVGYHLVSNPAAKIKEVEFTHIEQVREVGVSTWMTTDAETEEDFRIERDRRRRDRELIAAFAEQSETREFSLLIRLTTNTGQESKWAKLREIRDPDSATPEFIVELEERSLLIDHVGPGRLIVVDNTHVQEWKMEN